MKKSKEYSIELSGILFVVFLVLKLAKIGEVADWSWWWVTCPLWITPAIVLAIAVIGLLFVVITSAWESWREK